MTAQSAALAPAKELETIEVRPMAMTIGAEIFGADLTKPLPEKQREEIYATFLKWKVVFFRAQNLNNDQQVAFARQLGVCSPAHPVNGFQDPAYPEIYSLDKNSRSKRYKGGDLVNPWSGWHADITAAVNPPSISILRGDVVPPYGGDTQFADMVLAYQELSPKMRELVDGLRCIHRYQGNYAVGIRKEYQERIEKNLLISEHPLVTIHPETGERVLYISPNFVQSIVDVTPTESEALLYMLKSHAARPEFNVRFRWGTGDVIMWDNRQALHRAPRDVINSDFPREVHRITLFGKVPVGVDGRESSIVEGKPLEPVEAHI
jgi:alpha-ketoglutarate-dependent taurine dioxygenase